MNAPNIGALDALLTACGHTPLRNIQQHYDAEQGCWCVKGEVETMSKDNETQITETAAARPVTHYPYYDSLTFHEMAVFSSELEQLLHRHGLGRHTATPTPILAQAIVGYINDIQRLNKKRDNAFDIPTNVEEEGSGWEWADNERL